MINVLINAYAISPNWGSEPGLGWNWIINLAKYCNLYVITEGEWRQEIEKAIANLPQKDNIHLYYNPLPPKIRDMCRNQGDWRFYKYYRKWQEKTLEIAKEIISKNHIDIIHQLNMIGFREPGSLWKIKNIPFVWGPVGAYGWTTLKYLNGQPLKIKIKAFVKNIINSVQGKYYPLSNKAMRRASYVIAANSNVYKYIKKNHRKDVVLLNETGCYEKKNPMMNQNRDSKKFDILWVGKFDYRKQLELAVRTLTFLVPKYPFIKLKIVGDINNETFERLTHLSKKLGIDKNIEWIGQIPNKEVHLLMQESDVFLFTSIDEGTPHVVLEAIQNNLPVVCFDTCGQGDVVNDSIGIKIPLSTFSKSPLEFSHAISNLIEDRDSLLQLKQNCYLRQKELSWDSKIKAVLKIYADLLKIEK